MSVGNLHLSDNSAALAPAPEGRGSSPSPITAGIYIHIPFCKAKCLYCDFYSLAGRDEALDRYVDCIVEEIHQATAGTRGWRFDTLYIGGGTPSLLTPRRLEKIVTALQQTLVPDQVSEFTLEANPGEAPEEKLRAFRELGVNRLSLGFQSFDPRLLKFLGRLHDPRDCYRTFEAARRAGFDNVSADLLFNIPGQTLRSWQSDLDALIALGPEHISAYSLTVEKGTALHEKVAAGKITMPPEDLDAAMFARAREYLPGRGYDAYEISNYARDGKTCRHNLHYWRIEPYLGFGPSAHSFDTARRSWNVRSLDEYMGRVEGGRSPVSGEEVLDPVQLRNEKLAFGLRLSGGVSVATGLGYGSVQKFTDQFQTQLARWKGHLVLSGDRLSLTEKGVFLADTITADLLL